jgi:hypothetical protein
MKDTRDRFKLIKAIDNIKVGSIFNSFNGLVYGIVLKDDTKLNFNNKEYFKLIK